MIAILKWILPLESVEKVLSKGLFVNYVSTLGYLVGKPNANVTLSLFYKQRLISNGNQD